MKPVSFEVQLAHLELLDKGSKVVALKKSDDYMLIAGVLIVVGVGILVAFYEQKLALQQHYIENLLIRKRIE